MSWIQELYETYEACTGNLDIPDSGALCPVGYSIQNAHIEVVIDSDGNFRRASLIPKENAQTLIPVTEKSLTGRTSGIAPHPLCDSIQYCAGDYTEFGGKRVSYYPGYIKQLEQWVKSDCSHSKSVAVYKYIQKERLVSDLAQNGLLEISDGILVVKKNDSQNIKEQHPIMKLLAFDDKGLKDQAKVFIRWTVESDGDTCTHTWEDKSLFDSWAHYLASLESKVGFCYVTGEKNGLAQKHPGKLRSGKDGAKLISSNDTSGYTFLGRFTQSEQAAGISAEVSQKAHSALRWLIGRKQAFRSGDQVFVSWAVQGKDIPDPWSNSLDFLDEQEDFLATSASTAGDIGQSFALRLNKKIAGYKASISDTEDIVVMGLDSATPGRMAITFYRELTGAEFLSRIEQWHHEFAWYQNYEKELQFVGAPAPKDIARSAFGSKVEGKNGIKLLNATIERILPCIVDGAQFPKDLVMSSVRSASNRNVFKKEKIGKVEYETEWEKCLGIACSLYKGTNRKRSYKMALEEDRITRDYLYGRLLAMAERIESTALFFAKEKRETSAARLMQRFADRPFSTWRTIETALAPYRARINAKTPGLLVGYKELLDEIHAKFVDNAFSDDSRLSGEYLLGYHCQRKWLREHKREKGQWVLKKPTDPEIQETETEELVVN
jgi:CRISPR-associated protein Csd1